MKAALLPALFFSLGLAGAALADGKVFVPLPDMSSFAEDPAIADQLLTDLWAATVLSQNCGGASLSDAEHSLLTDSFDLLAYGELGLGMDEIIRRYEEPGFALLDNGADACAGEADLKTRTLAKLLEKGGSLEPLPDQEKAYLEWRALMDSIRP